MLTKLKNGNVINLCDISRILIYDMKHEYKPEDGYRFEIHFVKDIMQGCETIRFSSLAEAEEYRDWLIDVHNATIKKEK